MTTDPGDLPGDGGEPEGWCVYGDGWAEPAVRLPDHPVPPSPGRPRYAHPECHARAMRNEGVDEQVRRFAEHLATHLDRWVAGHGEGGPG